MNNSIVTYESFHGNAKRVAKSISNKLNCKCINIDTPFDAENLNNYNNLILVFSYRGPYTAQFTKLYLDRVKNQLKNINLILIAVGLSSQNEFINLSNEISIKYPSKTFNKFFIKGQLRIDVLTEEEISLLNVFGKINKIDIKDTGELDINKVDEVSEEILKLINSKEFNVVNEENINKIKWICPVCGYVCYGINPPKRCPLCKVIGNIFIEG